MKNLLSLAVAFLLLVAPQSIADGGPPSVVKVPAGGTQRSAGGPIVPTGVDPPAEPSAERVGRVHGGQQGSGTGVYG